MITRYLLNLQSRNNTNNTITMKKINILLLLAVAGVSNVMGQSGTITKKFLMGGFGLQTDTCSLSLSINNGKPTSLSLMINHRNKNTYILAVMQGEADRHNRYKDVETRINDFKSILDTAYHKYVEWERIAIENKVSSFSKQIGNYENMPLLNLAYVVNGIAYHPKTDWPYINSATSVFYVNQSGKSIVRLDWGKCEFERTKGYSQGFWTSYPIKEEVTCNEVFFAFNSTDELKNLIEALDINKAKIELSKNSETNIHIDSLFK